MCTLHIPRKWKVKNKNENNKHFVKWFQMDKFALEGKVKELETKIKDQAKKIQDLNEASNTSKQVIWSL